MKVTFLSIFIGLWASIVVAEDNLPDPVFLFVDRDSVVVRATPKGAKLGSLLQDTEVRLWHKEDKWVYVSAISGGSYIRGWMWADYLKIYQTNSEADPQNTHTRLAPSILRSPLDVRSAKRAIIAKSISDYSASADEDDGSPCACPYSKTRKDHDCGKRNAWTTPNGKRPRCYVGDVTLLDLDSHFMRPN